MENISGQMVPRMRDASNKARSKAKVFTSGSILHSHSKVKSTNDRLGVVSLFILMEAAIKVPSKTGLDKAKALLQLLMVA
jgi:hypothetical protein